MGAILQEVNMSIRRFAICLLLLGLPPSGLHGEDRPENLARSAVASASSTYTPGCTPGLHCYSPSRVNDGRSSTALGGNTSWSNAWQPLPQWVQLEWPSPITFSRVDLYLTTGYEILISPSNFAPPPSLHGRLSPRSSTIDRQRPGPTSFHVKVRPRPRPYGS